MKILDDNVRYEGKYIRLLERGYIGGDGKSHVWEVLERKALGRIVAIAAITPSRNIVLEKSFRIPLKTWLLEYPAGLMDGEGETEEQAIRRELLEETGYTVDNVVPLFAGPFDSGLSPSEIVLFGGTNARKVQEPVLETGEEIETVTVPVDTFFEFVRSNPELKVDIKLPAVFPLLTNAGLI